MSSSFSNCALRAVSAVAGCTGCQTAKGASGARTASAVVAHRCRRNVPRLAADHRPDVDRPARMAVVTCFFNPCGYAATSRNYRRFCRALQASGYPLFTIECAFGETPFELPPSKSVLQVRTGDVMWHKEGLLNRIIAELPDAYDKVAWVDADVLFTNRRWLADAERLLDEHAVVQVFEDAVMLGRRYQPTEARYGVARVASVNRDAAMNLARAHPGFGWAARREILARHGLFDSNIVGCGDGLMVYAMFGWWDHPFLVHYNAAMRRDFEQWGHAFHESVRGRVGFVPGTIYHLWHGERVDRRYVERIRYLTDHNFDPATDLEPDENGLWRWASEKPAMHAAVKHYFYLRQEDR